MNIRIPVWLYKYLESRYDNIEDGVVALIVLALLLTDRKKFTEYLETKKIEIKSRSLFYM